MEEGNQNTESVGSACERIEPILCHLQAEGLDHDKIRTHFNQLWEFENGDSLSPEEQELTTIGLFLYAAHAALDDLNLNLVRARETIGRALTAWKAPELEKKIAAEKASDAPFQTFVEQNAPQVEEAFPWRHFLLETKKADGTEWNYKMKKCWFAQFFIRYGRTDWIETACVYDKIPAEARKDYVNLKLTNTFAKLGTFCQFKYTPKT